MKRIRIYGCSTLPKLKQKLTSAAKFYREALLPRKRKLDITVKVIPDFYKTVGVYGECWQGDDAHHYVINICGNLSGPQILKTLAHEMIHVKQFSKGELRYLCKGDSWKGKVYSTKTPYDKQPWEREAAHFEEVLYNLWKSSEDSKKYK